MHQVTDNNASAPLPWQLGHYPYKTCRVTTISNVTGSGSRPTIVLMVASEAYAELIPKWSEQTRNAKVACAVGLIGKSAVPCQVARSSGCLCLSGAASVQRRPALDAKVTTSTADAFWSSGSDRTAAVQQRFVYALELMSKGYAVLMHDADVILRDAGFSIHKRTGLRMARPSSLELLLKFAYAAEALGEGRDFVVSDNGQWRKASFDGLNWGVVWMSGSTTCAQLLRCLLASWSHPAFAEPDPPVRGETTYWRRSQPRINHLVELRLQSGESALSLCMYNEWMAGHAYLHLTGLSTADQKISCARARGIVTLERDIASSERTLSYWVPPGASPIRQWAALLESFALAAKLNRTVHPPYAYSGYERIPICRLVDVRRLPPFTSFAPPDGGCKDMSRVEANLQSVSVTSALDRAAVPHLCIHFHDLARSHYWQYLPHQSEPIRVCNPLSRHVRGRHACELVEDWLPRPTPDSTGDAVLSVERSDSCPTYATIVLTNGSTRHALWDDPECTDGCSARGCGGHDFVPCCVKRQRIFWHSDDGMWSPEVRRPWPSHTCAGKEVIDVNERNGPHFLWRLIRISRAIACLQHTASNSNTAA